MVTSETNVCMKSLAHNTGFYQFIMATCFDVGPGVA